MKKIETSLLAKQVYDQIRQQIMNRTFLPGEKLDIQALADTYGVSRSPIKDAIQRLMHDGLIEVIPRKGTYVTEIQLDDFLALLETRLMIEQFCSQKVIPHLTDEQFQELTIIVQKMDEVLSNKPFNFEEYSVLDMQFHYLIVAWANNQRIVDIFQSHNTHVLLSRIVYSTSLESTILRHQDHHHLLKALKQRNTDKYHSHLTHHLNSVKLEAVQYWK